MCSKTSTTITNATQPELHIKNLHNGITILCQISLAHRLRRNDNWQSRRPLNPRPFIRRDQSYSRHLLETRTHRDRHRALLRPRLLRRVPRGRRLGWPWPDHRHQDLSGQRQAPERAMVTLTRRSPRLPGDLAKSAQHHQSRHMVPARARQKLPLQADPPRRQRAIQRR